MVNRRQVLYSSGALLAAASAHAALAGVHGNAPLSLTLTGQLMLRSDLRSTAPAAIPVIRGMLSGDVVFTNFEAAVALPGESIHEGRGFLTPPQALDALQAMGFNLVAFASNHAYDLKDAGIRNTLREADSRGIVHAGTGSTLAEAAAPAYLRTANCTVALVACASGLIVAGGRAEVAHPGVNELRVRSDQRVNEATEDLPGAGANVPDAEDAGRVLASVRTAREQADLVIAYQHNHVFSHHSFATIFTEGMEERLRPDAWLIRWAHRLVDAGADVVVLHGAPLLHGIEIYRSRPIFYDLGNFIYNVPPWLTYIHEPMAFESAVASLQFEGRRLASLTLKPVVLNVIGEGQPEMHDQYVNNQFLQTRGLPSPATGARAVYILQRLADLSKPFGTQMQIDAQTANVQLR
jgi:poly-gamma-glutamate synthesis protein (capsule biosynthesis protein)